MAQTPSTRQLQAEQPPCPQLAAVALAVFSVLEAPSDPDPFEPEPDPFESAESLLLLEPFLKSVAYHPLPRNWNPAAVSCFANVAPSHWGH
jgi:hypothetical protein